MEKELTLKILEDQDPLEFYRQVRVIKELTEMFKNLFKNGLPYEKDAVNFKTKLKTESKNLCKENKEILTMLLDDKIQQMERFN